MKWRIPFLPFLVLVSLWDSYSIKTQNHEHDFTKAFCIFPKIVKIIEVNLFKIGLYIRAHKQEIPAKPVYSQLLKPRLWVVKSIGKRKTPEPTKCSTKPFQNWVVMRVGKFSPEKNEKSHCVHKKACLYFRRKKNIAKSGVVLGAKKRTFSKKRQRWIQGEGGIGYFGWRFVSEKYKKMLKCLPSNLRQEVNANKCVKNEHLFVLKFTEYKT